MGISGSEKALCYALSGVARSGATRSDATSAHWFVSIGGTPRRGNVVQGSLVIEDALNEEPNRLMMTLVGLTPTKGQEVIVTLGSTNNIDRRFAGQILNIRTRYDGKLANIVRDIQASDSTALLNRRIVNELYTSTSATAIAQDLIDTYTTGFTYVHIAAGLEQLDTFSLTDETVSGALTRLANRIGGYWYVDYNKDIHFWTGTESGITNPTAITSTTVYPSFKDFSWDDDMTDVITRVFVEGNGSIAASDVSVGSTRVPVEDATYFNASGGIAKSGQQRITYTGLTASAQTGSSVATVTPSAPTAANSATGGGGLTVGATYRLAIAFYGATIGESPLSELSNAIVAVTDGAGGSRLVDLSNIALGPTGTTERRIYRTLGNGSIFYKALNVISDNVSTSVSGVAGMTDTNQALQPRATQHKGPDAAVGATSLKVVDTSAFGASGGVARVANQLLTYTGRSTTSNVGDLTGIPSSGPGSIVAPIPDGSAISNLPALTGVPASGAGSIQYAITTGDDVNLVAQVDDTAAQTALAALIGGDGIQEDTIQDRRLSETEAIARGTAWLAFKSAATVSAHYRSRDKQIGSGKTVTITSVNGLTGDLRIQRARWTNFSEGELDWPTIEVEASNTKFSLQDLLRQVRKQVEGIPS